MAIGDLFTNRPPNEAQAEMLDKITAGMLELQALLDKLPRSRFHSLATTKLEECSMWAKKATVYTYGVDELEKGGEQGAG